MDVRFCERRDHSREAPNARAKDLDQKSARSRERAWPRVFFLDRRLTWMSVSRDSNDSQTSGSPVRRSCATSLPAMAPSLIQGFLARLYARRQIKNSFGLRACLLHHFHKHFPSFSRIAYLPQECNARTAHTIRGPQSDLKTKPIDCCHGCFG
jgi:hypothetical protein